jgi:hypothetical protein
MPIFSRPGTFFDSLQSEPEKIVRRIKSGRNPSTGLHVRNASSSPMRPSTAATVPTHVARTEAWPLPESQRLNARVIETWLNGTLTDAESLDIPGLLLKPEHKAPMSRYGVDRSHLLVSPT